MKSSDEDSASHLELLVSLSPPVECLDVAAVNPQRLVAVSDGLSVLLHRQEAQRTDDTHIPTSERLYRGASTPKQTGRWRKQTPPSRCTISQQEG